MGDNIDKMQEIEERVRAANKVVKKKVPTVIDNKFCPYCSKVIMEEDNLQSVGDKDHRIFACLECENP